MCEAHAYIVSGEDKKRIMENVVDVQVEGDEVVLTDLFGDEQRIEGTLKRIALLEHHILLEPSSG